MSDIVGAVSCFKKIKTKNLGQFLYKFIQIYIKMSDIVNAVSCFKKIKTKILDKTMII